MSLSEQDLRLKQALEYVAERGVPASTTTTTMTHVRSTRKETK